MRFTTLIVRNLVRRGIRTALTVLGLALGGLRGRVAAGDFLGV